MAIARGEITITELYDGDNFYRAWADTPDGSGPSFTTEESNRAYLGVYSGREEPTHYYQYKWSRILGESAITAILSNDSHQIGTDENGDKGNYTGAKTTVAVFQGGEDDTLNWKVDNIKIEPAGAVTGEVIDTYTYKVEDLKTDEASVIFRLTHKKGEYSPLEKTFTLSKNKQGVSGQHATSYFLSFNDTALKKFRETGIMEPAELMMQGMSIKADQKPAPQSGYFKIYEQSEIALDRDQYEQAYVDKKLDEEELYVISEKNYPLILTYTSKEPEERLTYEYTDLINTMSIKVYWYRDADFEELIDVQTISITSDGEKGESGISYKIGLEDAVIKRDSKTGDFAPKSFPIKGYKGTGDFEQLENGYGFFAIYEQPAVVGAINSPYALQYTSTEPETELTYTIRTNAANIRIDWFKDKSLTILLDQQTIPIITDWQPSLNETNEKVEENNTRLSTFREATERQIDIRLGMKMGYSSFTQPKENSIYLSGLKLNENTFREELVNTPGSIYLRDTRQTYTIPNQFLSLIGAPANTVIYITWDNTDSELFLMYYETIYSEDRIESNRWRTLAGSTVVFDDSIFVLGELKVI